MLTFVSWHFILLRLIGAIVVLVNLVGPSAELCIQVEMVCEVEHEGLTVLRACLKLFLRLDHHILALGEKTFMLGLMHVLHVESKLSDELILDSENPSCGFQESFLTLR